MNQTFSDETLLFEDFALSLQKRSLTQRGENVRIGSRALDILIVLLERPGELVSRLDLLARVWPDTTVDENALRVHLSSLRKALGEKPDGSPFILNDAGRGYRFVGTVTRAKQQNDATPKPVAQDKRLTRLPKNLTRVIGRDDIVDGLLSLLMERRFLTIVGPGGIGKTTVALDLAHRHVSTSDDAAYFIDLAPLSDPALVATTVATQLGIAASSIGIEEAVAEVLKTRPTLLLFDNCEHLIDAVAVFVENILQSVPEVTLLVTSREPLRAEGEWVFRLPTLDAPKGDEVTTAASALTYPAVQLFCERAKASYDGFLLSDADVLAVNNICRRLDGIPLAIEMAAARMDTLDASDIAARLDDRFSLLTKGRRTALPRQQTLRATLEWSHDFLTGKERAVFRDLSVFRSSFQLDAVVAVSGLSEADTMETLAALVSKSLVVLDRSNRSSLYRLLDTTRFYAEQKLAESGQERTAKLAHARYTLEFFTSEQVAWDGNDPFRTLALHGWRVDDIRAALDWAFSPEGDAALGVELAVASAPLWFHLSLPGEYLSVLRRSIKAIEGTALAGGSAEAELMAAFGHALWHTEGPGNAMKEAFSRAMEIATAHNDEPAILRAIWGLWAQAILAGDYAVSLTLAEQFKEPAYQTGDIAHILTADHMLALSSHFMGNQDEALRLLNQVIAGDQNPDRTNHTNHAQVDGKTAVLSLLMRILWLKGDTETALRIAQDCAAHVGSLHHDLSTCYGLAIGSIPVALWAGRRDLASEWNSILSDTTTRKGMRHWQIWSLGFDLVLGGKSRIPDDVTSMQREVFATIGVLPEESWLKARLASEPAIWCKTDLERHTA
ncbi:ATP-binding protein [Rhizobium oryzicola]|uniref:Winged helix-turn-helix domain-containing protein n=1 Tax=Rhizobium oryzicola TaxID=1232668 RepID=A0ABT8T2G0_9HYPH|nr:winged helix-turn-helix domain-containing protein [Rhizobium oryzicola]MDO1584949.1 winged helix-turn-helix domain-containing protein [Rhizobium oryzicola]